MTILTRAEWGARPPNGRYVTIRPQDRPGTETHHSVGLYRATNPSAFARALQNDHLSRGWTDAFYNYAIWLDGTVIELRPNTAQSGAIRHLTICFAGNYETREPADAQRAAWHRFRAPGEIRWHGQRARVACPGRHVVSWLRAGAPKPKPPQEDDMPLSQEDLSNISKEIARHVGARDQHFVRITALLREIRDEVKKG